MGDLDEGGAAVGAAVGHFAGGEVFEEGLQLGEGEVVVGFDGVAAGGGGDHVFAEAKGRRGTGKAAQFFDDLVEPVHGVIGFEEGGKGFDFESVWAEGFEFDAEAVERFEVAGDDVGVFGGELEGERDEEALGGDAVVFHGAAYLFEHDAFVGGVLVHEDEAFGAFEEDVEAVEDAEDAVAGEVFGGSGGFGWGGGAGCGGGGGGLGGGLG